ncbi:hypothetical protein HNQ77_000891 [Silvibacterium bohemicum]|uniref:AsmA domain-containing protein n=1 Tax=Silvibacterium bohemicum TaxID=1577686 RepID=A0A841JQX4_9BACT|nr:AsmA family protein [Silvibacterium bohemicum]MBB6142947.1 hypothetical protein [Silvibacterium bohemicum]
MSGSAPGVAPVPAHRHEKLLRWFSLALIVTVIAAAFLLPLININRYHRTISETLARSIGHPVHLGSVKLQLLPRPGLAISDLVVEENSDFGAEPLLRSPSVVVSVRLTSLWRGRLEVSRIDLDEASVNLVRDPKGQWNFGSLLEQASRIPNAPTAQRHSGGNPRFPYIQFKSARINFKSGNEKKGFAFLNSDLSIWLDNPHQWRLRFEAQPARTDLDIDLEDTGSMRLEGSIDRAPTLEQMPVKLHAEWLRAPLGQVSRMLFADDMGWRGDLRAEADIAGEVGDMQVTTRLRVADAHRQEFSPLSPLNIDAQCRAEYRHNEQSLENLTCLWPVGDGHLLLTGNVRNFSAPQSQLTLEINRTPASLALDLMALLRPSLSSSWGAKGTINGSFTYATAAVPAWKGDATVEPLNLTFSDGGAPLMLPALHFMTPSTATPPMSHGKKHSQRNVRAVNVPTQSTIVLEPAAVDLGAPSPLQVSGDFTPARFSLHLAGSAAVGRLKGLTTSLASLRPSTEQLGTQGLADMDATVAGPWLAEPSSVDDGLNAATGSSTQGWIHLQNAVAKVDWLPEQVTITSATASFGGGKISWSNANVLVNGVAIRGSADTATRCESTEPCATHFNIDIPQLDAAALQSALLGAGQHGELLERILAEVERKTAPWPTMDGQVHIGAFALGDLILHNTLASISVKDHRLDITSLDAAALGGSAHATGTVEASGSQPQYSLAITWSGVDVGQVAALFDEKWPASGRMDGGTDLTLQGYSSSDLASSAQGKFHWRWNAGSLAVNGGEVANVAFAPSRFTQWNATGAVADRALTLNKVGTTNPVSGKISFDRKLDLTWAAGRAGTPLHVGGTLAHPAVENVTAGVTQ